MSQLNIRDMDNVRITVSRKAVIDEVARTTSYAGAKMPGDDDAIDRMSTVDEDEEELQRFWNECCSEVSLALKRLLVSAGMSEDGDTYEVVLKVTDDFDAAQLPSMEDGLFSYFVQCITSKWFVYVNKQEAGGYAELGKSLLESVRQKAFYKKAPLRPIYA